MVILLSQITISGCLQMVYMLLFLFINHGQVDNFQIIINSEGELIDDP